MKKGFTLIELLIVIIIVAVLAAVGLPEYFDHVEKNRALEMLSVTKDLQKAYEQNFIRNGTTTSNLDSLNIQLKGARETSSRYLLRSGAYVEAFVNGTSTDVAVVKQSPTGGFYGFHFTSTTTNAPITIDCAVSPSDDESGLKICRSFGGTTAGTALSYNGILGARSFTPYPLQ